LEKALTICKSKTEAGERVIPLNAEAWNTVLSLYERAKDLGDVLPEHYVFPACEASHFDPKEPQRSWRTAWRNITRLIQCPSCGKQQAPSETCGTPECKADLTEVKSPLAELRFHDLRHHAITELAESQASDNTVMAIAGHVSSKMLAHYSHVRIQAKRTALDSLSTKQAQRAISGGKSRGYDTNNDTKRITAETIPPQVLEKMVELVGIEPTTSSLRTMRSPS
jgi:integrase